MNYSYQNLSVLPQEEVIESVELKRNTDSVVHLNWGSKVSGFIRKYGNPDSEKSLIVVSPQALNISLQPLAKYDSIANLHRLNDVKRVCHFFKEVNHKLSDNGTFICCFETTKLRRKRIFKKFPPFLSHIYFVCDYLLKRVLPAIKLTHWINILFTGGRNKAITYYEMIGRLVYCGFRIEYDEVINGYHYFAVRKTGEVTQTPKEQYGWLLKLNRIGEGGKTIRVYKLRTMVPFSEFAQDYVYKKNSLQKGGKFRKDSRVTFLGAILRVFWIDEIPMLFNLLKGEIKLVGVRPLSSHYLSLYHSEVIQKRLSVKPGLIPPYYADLPNTLEEIQTSEMNYIQKWEQSPFKTDVIYFFKAMRNILWRGARSC